MDKATFLIIFLILEEREPYLKEALMTQEAYITRSLYPSQGRREGWSLTLGKRSGDLMIKDDDFRLPFSIFFSVAENLTS